MIAKGYGIQDTLLMLIAVSSFGESFRRVLHSPGGSDFKGLSFIFVPCAMGNITVNVDPLPGVESTHILPWWSSTIDLTIANPSPVPATSGGKLLPR